MHLRDVKKVFGKTKRTVKNIIPQVKREPSPSPRPWSRDLSEDILNLKAIETEALREQYQIGAVHRIKMFSERLEAVRQELSTRDLSNIPTDKLYDLLFKLSDNLSKEDTQPAFVKTSVQFPSLDTETTNKWSA